MHKPFTASKILIEALLHNNETWYIFAYSGYLMFVIILVLSYCAWLLYICMCFNKPFWISIEFEFEFEFPDCNSSLNSLMAMKWCTELLLFFKVICQISRSIVFQGHLSNLKSHVTRNHRFDPNWAFLDCYPSLISLMAMKWRTKLEVA